MLISCSWQLPAGSSYALHAVAIYGALHPRPPSTTYLAVVLPLRICSSKTDCVFVGQIDTPALVSAPYMPSRLQQHNAFMYRDCTTVVLFLRHISYDVFAPDLGCLWHCLSTSTLTTAYPSPSFLSFESFLRISAIQKSRRPFFWCPGDISPPTLPPLTLKKGFYWHMSVGRNIISQQSLTFRKARSGSLLLGLYSKEEKIYARG